MPRVCYFTGKKTTAWRTRSHSMRKWLRTYKPNLITKRVELDDGVKVKVKIAASQYKKYRGLI